MAKVLKYSALADDAALREADFVSRAELLQRARGPKPPLRVALVLAGLGALGACCFVLSAFAAVGWL